LSLTTKNEESSLNIDTLTVNGVPAEIIPAEIATKLLGHISSQRTSEYLFLRLEAKNVGGGGGRDAHMYVITATYDADEDDDDDENTFSRLQSSFGSPNSKQVATTTTTTTTEINSVSPFPLPKYPATVAEPFDRESQGNGLLVYGKDGYVLLGCDIVNLPTFVKNVTVRQHGYPGWVIPEQDLVGYSDTDPVYLPLEGWHGEQQKKFNNGKQNKKKRALGRVGIDDTGGGDINCILVDVEIADNSNNSNSSLQYSLSIYFVAARNENRHAIRVMDGDTFNVIAPTTLVEDYTGGVWWTLHYDRSVRLKMMDIEGIYLSAIAFTTDLS